MEVLSSSPNSLPHHGLIGFSTGVVEDPVLLTAPSPAPEKDEVPPAQTRNRWLKQWVAQDTILNNGKCFVYKWITESEAKALQTGNTLEAMEAKAARAKVTQGEVFVCTFEGCGKVFYEASALRKHSHTHGEKQFVCHYEGCGKRFVDSSKLKRHFLIHTGEKHFICPFDGCGKAFSLDFNLRSHMRTHTLENYHTCPYDECGKRYAHEYKLRAHIKAHHDQDLVLTPPQTEQEEQMMRDELGEGSGSARPQEERRGGVSKKEREEADDEGERPFVCPHAGCRKRYIHEYKLNLHLRKEHMENEGGDGGGKKGAGEDGSQKVKGKGKDKEGGKKKGGDGEKKAKEEKASKKKDGEKGKAGEKKGGDGGKGEGTKAGGKRKVEEGGEVHVHRKAEPALDLGGDLAEKRVKMEDSEETQREDSEETEPEYGAEGGFEVEGRYEEGGMYGGNMGYDIGETYRDDRGGAPAYMDEDEEDGGMGDEEFDDDATEDELEEDE